MRWSATCTHTVTPREAHADKMGDKTLSDTASAPAAPNSPKVTSSLEPLDSCRQDSLLTASTKPMFGIFLRAQRHGSFVTRCSCRGVRPKAQGWRQWVQPTGPCQPAWGAARGFSLGAGLGGRARTAWARPDFPTVPHSHFFVKKKVKG